MCKVDDVYETYETHVSIHVTMVTVHFLRHLRQETVAFSLSIVDDRYELTGIAVAMF